MKKKIDPFTILPEEVCDEILSYLNVRDIKEASLVTKYWYSLIGRTKSCMEKLCLKPKNSPENVEFFESILNSTRIYQNLEMVYRYSDVKKNTKFLRLVRNVVTKFADSLISLKISNDLIIKQELPKLKELNFCGYNYKSLIAANGVLTKTRGLEKLEVEISSLDEKSMKYLRRFLMENDSLKVLRIEDGRVVQGLNSDNIKFKLDEFKTEKFYGLFRNLPELMDFLSAHKSTLKATACELSTDYLPFLMSNFPELHTLTLECEDRDILNYPYNATITNVKINIGPYEFSYFESTFTLHIVDFIQKLQNLQNIEIRYISSAILHALFNSRTLKTVKYHKLKVTSRDRDEMDLHEHIKFIKL